jgi:hypothetical protein
LPPSGARRIATSQPEVTYAVAVFNLIRNHPLCVECIATKTDITEAEVLDIVQRVGRELVMVIAERLCAECGKLRPTYMVPSRQGV